MSNMKSQHTKKPIAELLKRFRNGVDAIEARDGSNICVLCDNCIDTINAYDEAFMLSEQVEKQLREMIARTEKRYASAKYGTKICETEKINANPMRKEPLLTEGNVVADLFDVDEMHADQYSHFDGANDVHAENMSEPEEDIESVEEEFDSDDSFVWPKTSALKRKQVKETGRMNVKKKSRIYSCIDCPADYYDNHDMQVNT